tara:strand:+ start:169 stop:312 length:144 start_codon:yes stop_codon:yes gene_type:complete
MNWLAESTYEWIASENIALEDVITEIIVLTIAIKKLTDNAKKTVFDD